MRIAACSNLIARLSFAALASLSIAIAGCGGGGGDAVMVASRSYAESGGEAVPGGAGSPTPSSYVSSAPAVNASDNVVTIREAQGVTTTDYPIQLGRVFLKGEIADYPQALIDGKGVETQADVKTRWPDGSVKHAILSFYIPTLEATETRRVTFSNQATTPAGGLSNAQMLEARFNFDSVLSIASGGQTASASAKQMLSSGHVTRWLDGPVSTSVILADHGNSRTYDLGFDAYRSLRPVFHATFWPRINKVFVRVIGETSNPDAWQTIAYDLTVTGGASTSATVYSKPAVTHHPASRWTRSFWIGAAPGKVNIDHNMRYLAASGSLPNFDPSITVAEAELQAWHAKWAAAPKGVLDAGTWEKSMGTAGGRSDIGIYPTWVVLWLYTGDYRLADITFGHADLAGAWPFHFRETKADRSFAPGFPQTAQGRPFSVFGRPTFALSNYNVNIRHPNIRPEDRINFVGSEGTYGGWTGDDAHQPDPFSTAYMLTGEFWYLEQLQFWASWGTFIGLAAPSLNYSRGPLNTSGGIPVQDRAQAWLVRNRALAAWLSPEGSPEKVYFERQLRDAIAIWEGQRNISGTEFTGTPEWTWGAWSNETARATMGVSPLGIWSLGITAYASDANLISGVASRGSAPWQVGFVATALGRTRELGYPTTALLEWMAPFYNQVTAGGEQNFGYLATYVLPSVLTASGRVPGSWSEVFSAFKPEVNPLARFRGNVGDLDHGYANIACAGSTYVANLPGGAASQSFCKREQTAGANFSLNPKWALIPK